MTKKQLAETFGVNLESERLTLGYSQQEMAKALEMSLSSYKRLLNGESNKIDLHTAYLAGQLTDKLCDELCGLPSPIINICASMRQLSDSQLNFIRAIIEFEVAFAKKLQTNNPARHPEDYIPLMIPSGNMQDGMIYDTCDFKKIYIAPYRKRYGDQFDCAILITSTHMHPAYNLNDILLVSRTPIRDGDTGIFLNVATGLAYIRKFFQTSPCRLEPISSYGRTFYINCENKSEMAHWIKFGRVVTKIRTQSEITT